MRSLVSHALGIFTVFLLGALGWHQWSRWESDRWAWRQAQDQAIAQDLQLALQRVHQRIRSLADLTAPSWEAGVVAAGHWSVSALSELTKPEQRDALRFDHQMLQATVASWWPTVVAGLGASLKTSTPAAQSEIKLISFKANDQVRKEWLALVTVAPGSPLTVTVRVVDPLSVLQPLHGSDPKTRLSLWNANGRVVAHPQSAYVGTSLLDSPYWKKSGTVATADVQEAQSPIDRLPARWLSRPLGQTGFWLALEKSPEPSKAWQDRLTQSNLLQFGGLMLAVLGGLLGVWLWRGSRQPRRVPSASPLQAVADAIQQQIVETEPAPTPVRVASEPSPPRRVYEPGPTSANEALKNDAFEMVQTFEQKSRELAERIQDRQLVVGMLTEMASKLCASPTLFFRYRPELQAAVLATDSGFEAGGAPSTLSFPLDSVASHKIVACIEEGKIASLSNYEPLAKLLLSRMGIAVFDAWAVTSPGVSGTKLLGVLVILQSSAQSAMHFETLVRMMRTTGRTLQNIPQPT